MRKIDNTKINKATVITISQLSNIITLRQAEELAGQEFYVITERGNKIVGKIAFKEIDVDKIVEKKVYTRI